MSIAQIAKAFGVRAGLVVTTDHINSAGSGARADALHGTVDLSANVCPQSTEIDPRSRRYREILARGRSSAQGMWCFRLRDGARDQIRTGDARLA